MKAAAQPGLKVAVQNLKIAPKKLTKSREYRIRRKLLLPKQYI